MLFKNITQSRKLDTDVASYATSVSLPGDQSARLSLFLRTVKNAGVVPSLITLGRSEFLARNGATHHALIGPDATITGTLGNTTDGVEFDTGSGDIFEFDNPMPFTSNRSWQLVVAIPDVLPPSSYFALISGANGNSGPEIRMQTSPEFSTQYRVTTNGSTLIQRVNIYTNGGVGVPMMYVGQKRSNNIDAIVGFDQEDVTNASNTWNNETKWRLGASLGNFGRMDGKIPLAMAGLGSLTSIQRYALAGAIVRHNIGSINPPRWIAFVGDSMTVGVAGGAAGHETRSCLWVNNSTGWKGSFFDNLCLGGTGWTGTPSPNQSEQFATALAQFAVVPDMPRTIVFWAGFNIAGGWESTQAGREAAAAPYIAAASQAAALGIQTVHWSRPVDYGAATPGGGGYWDNIQLYNDYYKAAILALPGDHIFYDHRITFSAGEFDGATANPLYYADQIHLTALGQSVLMDDFLTQYPNP